LKTSSSVTPPHPPPKKKKKQKKKKERKLVLRKCILNALNEMMQAKQIIQYLVYYILEMVNHRILR
jgi:hypothetical protein